MTSAFPWFMAAVLFTAPFNIYWQLGPGHHCRFRRVARHLGIAFFFLLIGFALDWLIFLSSSPASRAAALSSLLLFLLITQPAWVKYKSELQEDSGDPVARAVTALFVKL